MFFPLRDDNPTRVTPRLTYALIAVNVLVHLVVSYRLLTGVYWLHSWYGLVPARFLADPVAEGFTVFSSMFLHADWMHVLSNMWFLHIFGDNVEEALGTARFVAFYLLCGIAAAVAQVLVDPSSSAPMVGASGAIAGIVGGYVLLYPKAPIFAVNLMPLLWLVLGVFLLVPAWVIAAIFFAQNVIMGWASLGMAAEVAFFAHIGGFIAGVLLIKPLLGQRPIHPRRWQGFRPPESRGFGRGR